VLGWEGATGVWDAVDASPDLGGKNDLNNNNNDRLTAFDPGQPG